MIDDEFSFITEFIRDAIEILCVLRVIRVPETEPYVPDVFDRAVQSPGRLLKFGRRNQSFERVDVGLEPLPTLRIEAREGMDLRLVLFESDTLTHWEKYP